MRAGLSFVGSWREEKRLTYDQRLSITSYRVEDEY
jgi:hypothetical protein